MSRRILVVDDQEDNRRILRDLFTASGFEVIEGKTGEEGVALAEAQAMGVPAVVRPLGSTQERVIDGVTGRVAEDDEGFAEAAVRLLRDDGLWRRWHLAALARQRGLSWDAVGARFEALA